MAARCIAAALLITAVALVWAGPAAAHTGFESSDPPDGAVLVEPVTEVELRFSGPAAPTGEGFVVRLPNGDLIEPAAAADQGETAWRLQLPEPVVDGVVAVRWEVKAPDAHPIAGSFSFTVASAATEPDREVVVEQAVVDPAEPVASGTPAAPGREPVVDSGSGERASVEEFLAVPDAGSEMVSLLGYAGRFLGLGGTIAVVGLLTFAMLVLTPGDPERGWLIRSSGPIGMVVVVGALLESTALTIGTGAWAAALETGRWASVLQSNPGIAIVLRIAGGIALICGVWSARVGSPASAENRAAQLIPDLSAPASLVPGPEVDARSLSSVGPRGWWPLLAGCGLLLGVVVFDGHTATSGQRVMTGLVDVVHVFAGGVWAGGVVGLAGVLSSRHRRGVALDGLRLGVRFSTIAALASAMAGVAGVALAFVVLDGIDQLINTPWGRVLIAKVLLVVMAALIGSYNHFVVLRSVPTDQTQRSAVSAQLRRLVVVEATVLIVIVAVTALLVAARSTV